MASEAFSDLKTQLSPSELEKVEQQLWKGKSAKSVMTVIQGEFGKLKDKSEESMIRMLNRYRNYGLSTKVAEKLVDAGVPSRLDNIMTELDVAEDLAQITELFRLRIHKMAMLQLEMPIPSDSMRQELVAFSKHLETVVKLHLELGLMDGAPKTVAGLFQNVGTGETIKFEVTENWEDKLASIREEYLGQGSKGQVLEGKAIAH